MINHAKSYVTSKNIKVFKPWYKQISANSNLPYGIKTRETVKGFSGNKGNFVIISYKDKDGNILQKVISYPDRNEVTTKDFTYDDFLTYVHT